MARGAIESVDGEVQAAESAGFVGFRSGIPEALFERGVVSVLFGWGDPDHE